MGWSSLDVQYELARALFGQRGERMLQAWLDDQLERVTSPSFAALFADNLAIPGAAPADFNHRMIRHQGQELLGGIRFYGGQVEHPFVEVVAHGFSDEAQLRTCVAAEWSQFKPKGLRLLVAPDQRPAEDAVVDTRVYAARYGELRLPDGRIKLRSFASPEDAVEMVEQRFLALRADQPELAARVFAASPDHLRAWHADNTLRAIEAEVDGVRVNVGLLAIRPDRLEWLEGDVVQEEIVLGAYAGHGFAASAQMAWGEHFSLDPSRLLLGTIDGLNVASSRTAHRVGRRAVLEYCFLPLGDSG